ncbi:uncharacterized protein LOC133793693 [Humulus lupulus]|uniref:uncharacterized protein LOC133793693 n=1 Tax=Humulus lupulus TaxID=3486 RepID=UPI002B40F247|nr:uncharacterized protein LOC133793693 [Humulus lupulus]
MGTKDRIFIALFFRVTLFYIFSLKCCSAIYNITSSRALSQGQTLVSSNQLFELGFFSPNNSANKYVGIWYKQISPLAVVWVANRDNPLTVADSPPSLTIGSNGNLELLDRNNNSVWSTNVEIRSNNSSVAILSDYGNLILKDGTQDLWESFKHPADTFLPGAELGFNVKTGESFVLTSWKSNSDPAVGKFTAEISKQRPPQAIIWVNESKAKPHWRSGPWAKSKFSGIPQMNTFYQSPFNLVEEAEQGTTRLRFNWDYSNSTVSNMFLNSGGVLTIVRQEKDDDIDWDTNWEAPETPCDVYGVCGPFGVCNDFESPVCKCMKGFGPKSLEEWSKGNWTRGCERRSQLLCDKNTSGLANSQRGKKDGFWKIGNVKVPDFYKYVEPLELDFADTESCQKWCLNNCSCIAYSYVDNIGCLVWSQGLIDIERFSDGGEDLFLRLAHSELVGGDKVKKIIISFAVLSTVGIIVVIVLCLRARRVGNNKEITEHIDLIQSSDSLKDHQFSRQDEPSDLPSFDFGTILHVTNNFSSTNKLGQGGFGSVYKGKLADGREIAVKRLSSSSGQGTEEFKNELILISKLQHRNLVRLLGCCIEKEERLLVYELMPNKSLDNYIFDPRGREQLNWDARMNIILGVARGLLYLHRDSSLRVIHRDLKASNILLDEKMNPKISDFGLARIFQETIDLANSTQRVVGTLGYMSPEYAMGGVFSEKSDVFSFGVLILEIVSGKRNSNFHYYEQNLSLVAYAWQLWSEGRGVEFVDDAIGGSYVELEAIRCLHVGLLCVQDHTTDRPSMADVVLMLGNETNRPQPIRPIFIFHNSARSKKPTACSVNEATVSMIEGRIIKPSLSLLKFLVCAQMGAKDRDSIALFFRALFHLVSFKCCSAIYNITSSQALSQGQTLVSSNQVFELGFFTPNNTANKFVGIWYKQVSPRRVVWVANRDSPITVADSPPSLTIGSNGNLELLDRNNNSVWSTNVEIRSDNSSVAILSDYGNLILKDDTQDLWESFKHPADTFLPGAEFGFNVKTGESFVLTSWKSNSDPAVGKFTAEISKQRPPQAIIWVNESKAKPHWRSGPWAKSKFSGIPQMNTFYQSPFNLVEEAEQGTTRLRFNWDYSNSTVSNMFLTSGGVLTIVRQEKDEDVDWETNWEAPETPCDVYGVCGPFGVCNDFGSPVCKCMKGFGPKSLEEWSKGNWTRGCERRSQLLCDKNTSGLANSQRGKKDGFWKIGNVKVPDFYKYVEPLELDFADTESCQKWCLNNCSCIAYSYVDNIGCLVWSQGLIDIERFSDGGEDLFLRLAHSELVGGDKVKKIIISFAVLSTVGIIVVIVLCSRARRVGNNKEITEHIDLIQSSDSLKDLQFSRQDEPSDLPSFDFGTILHVTNNFSSTNKLGQGGFGSVYKGKLADGREIAVKRLSSSSGQGTEEFKNELILISKLQHRNLVRLLGCCIEKEERLLVYELMPNKSLDNYIFDPRGREQLNWDTRVNIILGVARGLLYLHRDSSLRVIHRDLKASNILLDEKMNPKISDFGLARIFQETIDLANSTQRVVGTLGYMSPEYAMGGVFSEKSDVFSFGVLILEIVSGKRNSNFHYYEQNLSLVAYAWQLWSEGRGVEFVDDAMGGSYVELEAIRCLHVGLLCVQDHTTDRPSMADVVLMLGNETNRPQPIRPIFIFHNSARSRKPTASSVNEATVSMIEGR